MKWHTHVVFSILVFVCFWKMNYFSLIDSVLLFVGVLIAGLLPDIDSSKSAIGRWFVFLNYGSTHRGLLHSLWGIAFVGILCYLLFPLAFTVPVMISFLMHLFLDALNPKGIRLLYPFPPTTRGFITSGTIMEYVVEFLGIMSIVFVFFI